MTGSHCETFGEVCRSTYLTFSCYWLSSHCIPTQIFVSLELNYNCSLLDFRLPQESMLYKSTPAVHNLFTIACHMFIFYELRPPVSSRYFCFFALLMFCFGRLSLANPASTGLFGHFSAEYPRTVVTVY